MQALKELPEKTHKLIVLIVSLTFALLVGLAVYGAYEAREPLPEMIIAPADSINNQA